MRSDVYIKCLICIIQVFTDKSVRGNQLSCMMSVIICAHGNVAYKEKIVVSFGKGRYKSLVVCFFLFKY